MPNYRYGEGLRAARLLMVLSSISPLFVIWAIRGSSLIPDLYFLFFCSLMVIVPYVFLWWRIRTAKKLEEKRELTVGTAEDHRDHILVYLFAILLSFYAADLSTWRDLAAALVAIGFIVFLFWHLNLHYMNMLFAAKGYRVFTIYAPTDKNPLTDKTGLVLITQRVTIPPGQQLVAYRISNTVYMEV
jgi:hypothetical protein